MQITTDEVKHIAKLARLYISKSETEKFSTQISNILSYAKILEEVNTDTVEPIAQITGLKNINFKDEVQDCKCSDKLLSQSPQDIQDNMIKVKNVF